MKNPVLNERLLADLEYVHPYHVYVCDGALYTNTLRGTVRDLKREQGFAEVREPDIENRVP